METNDEPSTSALSMEEIIEKKCDTRKLLDFELQLLLDIIYNDGLVVAAKGINLDYVLLNLMKVYCDEGNLVFVVNATEHEEKFYISESQDSNMHNELNSAPTSEHRVDMYLSGGIHFVSTRILVLDMLKKKIPMEKITGIIILRAHKIIESCQEAFVLRLFRQSNKTGFVKAFTNSAQSFTMGFGHVERIMRNIFVKELYLWPRFHSSINSSLKKYEPQVIELHVPISENMRKIQTFILELMNLTVKELKKINKTIEIEEITTENCLTKKFHKILQVQLDLIWNELSNRSRQLISDLKTLRHLIITMLYSDPITFYSLLSEYRKSEYARNNNWVLLKPAELLFSHVSSLLFTGDRELNPEFCPKWNTLIEILKVEIPQEIQKSNCSDNKILILCSDRKTCFQLNELLRNGPQHYLFFMALKNGISFKSLGKDFENCGDRSEVAAQAETNEKSTSKRKKLKVDAKEENDESKEKVDETENADEAADYRDSYILTMSQTMMSDETLKTDADETFVFEPFSQLENIDITQLAQAAIKAPTIIIQTFKGADNYINLERTLETISPNYVVMYNSNITAIREIEMYEAHRKKDRPLKIFFLIHSGTVEEQSYLTALRREKEAFEYLINTKSRMVIPEDQDGKSDCCLTLQNISSQVMEKSSRKGGKDEDPKKQYIIVDMREFRSELPVLIHRRGIQLEPYVITVGDYILTPDICIERKSISDLIGSLKSGRLYQQCTQMSRYYTKPMLLIEFDQNKSFSWHNVATNFDQVQQKLLLLTIHFPKLRIIWSPNPYASAQLFEELKQNKEEPNIEYATSVGDEQDINVIETKYNSGIYDFVRKLPGINSKNIDSFLRRTKSMNGALKLTEDELKDVLGNAADAKVFYECLHGEHSLDDENDKNKGKGKFKKSFKNK